MDWHKTPWTPPNLSYFFVKISLSHFSYLSHLKTTASRRHSCKSRPSKPFKHFPDRTQGCLMFCTQQQIIYIPHVILFVSAVLWHHFTGPPRLSWGWYPAGRARLIRQREDDAYVLESPTNVWSRSRCADKGSAQNLPRGPSHHVLIILSCHPFIFGFWTDTTYLNRAWVSFYYYFQYYFYFFLMGNLAVSGTNLAQKPLFGVQDTTEKWVSLFLQSRGGFEGRNVGGFFLFFLTEK